MPILKGATTFARFRVEHEGREPNWGRVLPAGLRAKAFVPLDRTQQVDRSAGFAELEDPEKTDFAPGATFLGEYVHFTWRVDEFRIPASQVKAELDKWARDFEKENERAPGRREKQNMKLELRHTLRARAPVVTRTFDVSWNLQNSHLLVWTASRKLVDEVQSAVEAAAKVKLLPLVPVVVAKDLEIDDKALAPTQALSLPDQQTKQQKPEAVRGKA